jgi:hypothetical protein
MRPLSQPGVNQREQEVPSNDVDHQLTLRHADPWRQRSLDNLSATRGFFMSYGNG